MRFLGGAALAAVTVLALSGCGSQATAPTSSPTVTVAPSATAAVTATASATTSPAPSGSTASGPTAFGSTGASAAPGRTSGAADPDRPRGQCPDDSLGVTVVRADGGGGAGSSEYQVLFTNTGGTSCVLRGTPGVSVVGDGNGTQLGKSAARDQSGVRTVTLADGQSVAASLRIVSIGTDGGPLEGCTVQKGDGYRIYPPHSSRAFLYRDADAVACVRGPSFMSVGPVQAKTD